MLSRFREDRLLRNALIIGFVADLIMSLLYVHPLYRFFGKDVNLWVNYLLTIAAALLALVGCFLLWRSFSRGEVLWTVWGALGLGVLLWSIAEILAAYYDIGSEGDSPFPSWADAAWLLGYLPLFAAFYLRYRSLRVSPSRLELFRGGGAFLIVTLLVLVLVVGPIITSDDFSNQTEQIITILYPLGDLVLAFGILLSVMAMSGGQLARSWIILLAGFLVIALADLFYLYGDGHDLYQSGLANGVNLFSSVSDILYVTGYVIIALGILDQGRAQRVI